MLLIAKLPNALYRFFAVSAFLFCTASTPLFAKDHFEWTPLATQAYERATQLRFVEASSLLQRMEAEDPHNLVALHIANYIDFFKVYLNEDYEEFQRLEKNKNLRLTRIRQGDESSPWFLFLQADIRLHWALARLKFEEYATAFLEVNKAYKLLRQNAGLFPDFLPNYKDLGILHAAVGSIPDNYRWAVTGLSSLQGDLQQGRSELERVLRYAETNPFLFEEETRVLYAYLLLHFSDEEDEAWKALKGNKLQPKTNPLACFVLVNVAMRTGRNDEAIRLLENRPQGRAYHPFWYLDFLHGVCLQRRLDPAADEYLQRFVRYFKGRHFIKEAYQKLAWQALLQGRKDQYFDHLQSLQQAGNAVVGSDASAQREAEAGEMPQVNLLRARLLFDGAYYQRAAQELERTPAALLNEKRHQLEHNYRLGRVYQALGKSQEAIRLFDQCMEAGENEPWYFACRSALEAGRILERRGEQSRALIYYQRCLSIKPAEHAAGLHQQAKAGVLRVKSQKK